MKIGDTVKRRSVSMNSVWVKDPTVLTGKVVYIHPQNRFFVLEAQLPGGKVREAFYR